MEATQAHEIPFELRSGLIWVHPDNLWLHPENPRKAKALDFILDSGAEASVVDLDAARRLGVELGRPVTVRGVSATAPGNWTKDLSVRVGGIALRGNLLAMDLSAVGAACQHRADGLVGADFFSGRVVQIDFAAHRIRVLEHYRPGAAAEVLPLRVEGSRLWAPVAVEGLGEAWARLDTGSAPALQWEVPNRSLADGGSSRELAVGVSSQVIHESPESVRLGGLSLEAVPTGLHAEPILAGEAGLLGSGILARFAVVTIDEPGSRLVLEGLSQPRSR